MSNLLLILADIPLVLYRAFVFTKLWFWFVVPALHMPPISLPVGWGIMSLLTLATADTGLGVGLVIAQLENDETRATNRAEMILAKAIYSTLILIIGYAAHKMM